MQSFDVIVVGTSPLSLLEAALAKRAGKSVCVIERNDRLGGAWFTEDALDLKNIETTPHLFVPEQSAYRALDEYLDAQFQDLTCQPQILVKRFGSLYKSSIIPLSQRFRVTFAMFLTEYIDNRANRWPKRIFKGLKFLYRQAKYNKLFQGQGLAKYPSQGLSKWFERIERQFEQENITLKLRTSVNMIEFKSNECCLHLHTGEFMSAERVVLNRHSDLSFCVHGRILNFAAPKKRYSNHLAYIVRNAAPMPFVQAIGNSELMLFNDVTEFSGDLDQKFPGCRLITMRTIATDRPTVSDPQKHFDRLKQLGVLLSNVEFLDCHIRQICTSTLSRKTIDTVVSEFSGAVDFLHADDLGIMTSIASRCLDFHENGS